MLHPAHLEGLGKCVCVEGVAPSPTHWCSSYRKGSLRVTLDYGRQLYLLYIYNIYIYTYMHVEKGKTEEGYMFDGLFIC